MSAETAAAESSTNSTAKDWAILIRNRLGKEVEGYAEPAEMCDRQRTIFRVPKSVKQHLDEKTWSLYTPQQISLGLFHRPGRYNAPQAGEDLKLQMAGAFLISIYTKQCSNLPEPNESLEPLMYDPDFAQEFSGVSEVPMESIVGYLTADRRERVWRDLCHHVVGRHQERPEGHTRTNFWKQTVDCYDLRGDDCIKFENEPTDVLQSALTLDAILVGCFLSATFCREKKLDFPFPLVYRCFFQSISNFFSYAECFFDFLKLENQIPLKLLEKVLNVIWTDTMEAKEILNGACAHLMAHVVISSFPGYDSTYHAGYLHAILKEEKKFLECEHLLGCAALVFRIPEMKDIRGSEASFTFKSKSSTSAIDRFARRLARFRGCVFGVATLDIKRVFSTMSKYSQSCGFSQSPPQTTTNQFLNISHATIQFLNISNATILHEAGIHVRGCSSSCSSGPGFELIPKFEPGWLTGTLHVPKVPVLSSKTWLLWRNLAVYESENPGQESQLLAFLTLMDCLVDTEEDILLLMKGDSPVFEDGYTGSPEFLAGTFNSITIGLRKVGYPRWIALANQINNYQKQKYRKMLLEFVRTNFGKPWLIISVLAAIALLVLTFLQTFYAIRTYYP